MRPETLMTHRGPAILCNEGGRAPVGGGET
jgi:hypothetical protein